MTHLNSFNDLNGQGIKRVVILPLFILGRESQCPFLFTQFCTCRTPCKERCTILKLITTDNYDKEGGDGGSDGKVPRYLLRVFVNQNLNWN